MIHFGLIGFGKIGERHVHHIQAHPEATLTGVFDIKADRLNLFRNQYKGFRTYDSLKAILNDPEIEVVSICTPNYTHSDIAIAAMTAGKHALVEKPMAIRKVDCEGMIHIALKTGKSLFVVKQNRFNPPVQAVKKLLDEGKFGRIFSVAVNCFWNRSDWYYRNSEWKGKKAFDGGTLYTQFSHFIDIVYYLLGDMTVLHAQLANVNHKGLIEFEDTGIVSFRLKSSNAPGVLHYTTAAFDHNMEGSITIFAEHATIKIGGKYLNMIEYQATDGFDITGLPASNPANVYGEYEGSMSNHDQVFDNVIRSLQGREAIMTNAYDGLKTVEIIENIYHKASEYANF